MSTWPDPTGTVSTTDMDNDTDSLTAARADILDLTTKFNQVLGTCTIASTPWTDLNDATIQKRIGSGTTNGIVLEDSNGDVITSGKTIETTITSSDTKVPTSKAVETAIAAVPGSPFTYHEITNNTDLSFSGTRTSPTVIADNNRSPTKPIREITRTQRMISDSKLLLKLISSP